jgi:hypothetical protein
MAVRNEGPAIERKSALRFVGTGQFGIPRSEGSGAILAASPETDAAERLSPASGVGSLVGVKWTVEHSIDLEEPLWTLAPSVDVAPTFEEFEELFVGANGGEPEGGYYRIRIEGSKTGWAVYSWAPEGRLRQAYRHAFDPA